MRHFILNTLIPKPKMVGTGCLSVSNDGHAQLFSGDGGRYSRVLAEMKRARLEYVSANGMKLSGMEPAGIDRNGEQRYAYQEWWIIYNDRKGVS